MEENAIRRYRGAPPIYLYWSGEQSVCCDWNMQPISWFNPDMFNLTRRSRIFLVRNGSLSLKNGSRTPTWPKSARSKYLPRIFPQSLGVSNAMFDYWKVARYRQPLQSFHFVPDWVDFFSGNLSIWILEIPWFQLQFPFYIHLLTPLRYSNKWNNGNLVPRDFTPENLLFVDGKKNPAVTAPRPT